MEITADNDPAGSTTTTAAAMAMAPNNSAAGIDSIGVSSGRANLSLLRSTAETNASLTDTGHGSLVSQQLPGEPARKAKPPTPSSLAARLASVVTVKILALARSSKCAHTTP